MVVTRFLKALQGALDPRGEVEPDNAHVLAARALLPSITALTCSDIFSLSIEYYRLAKEQGYPKGHVWIWPETTAASAKRSARKVAHEAWSIVESTIRACDDPDGSLGVHSEILGVSAVWGPALSAAADGVLARAAADLIPLEVRKAMAAPLLAVIPGLPILDA